MQVSANAYPIHYGDNAALRQNDVGQRADLPSQRHLRSVPPPPQESILEGELLNKRRAEQQKREEESLEFIAREYEKRQQSAPAQNYYNAGALAEYQENALLNGNQVIRERSALVDVYV